PLIWEYRRRTQTLHRPRGMKGEAARPVSAGGRCEPGPWLRGASASRMISRRRTNMERRQLGQTDMHVSVLGFGGAEIGYEGAAQETVTRLLHSALDAGLNVIDTAECYYNSEELIGHALASRRGDYYLFSKCGHEGIYSNPDWRPESLLRSS